MEQPSSGQFAYQAQTTTAEALTGTITAPDAQAAARTLEGLGLRVLEVTPAQPPARRGRPVRGEDFLAFNQQLAQMTAAGLPVEYGLRLIARDMRSGRLAATIDDVAADLEAGQPLGEAFDRHADKFPPLYGRLVQAGVRANNLPAMLLNLGRHLEMVQRLRALLWRAFSYPLMVVIGLLVVMAFLGLFVLPQFASIFKEFKIQLPLITDILLTVARAAAPIAAVTAVAVIVLALLWRTIQSTPAGRRIVDVVGLRIPLVGGVLRWNMVARWCDALRLAVESGVDLPGGIALANDAVGSPALARDANNVWKMLESGEAVRGAMTMPLRVLPPTVPAAIGLASERYDLATTLGNLADMYQRQAELRMGSIPTVLAPVLLVTVAVMIGTVVVGVLAPLIVLIRSFTK